MNNGGANTHRDNAHASTRRPAADDFGLAVSRVAVAQICESVGFESFRDSALDSLADIAVRYLRDLGRASGFYANLAGRTECNVFDIIRALEDLGNFQGFSGAAMVSNCVAGSGIMREIMDYAETAEEIPFAHPLPRFPVNRERRLIPSFDHMGETPSGKHIPSWLPALPDPHTYKQTPMWNERKSDLRADKLEQARQRRKAERSLLNLQQRLAVYGSAGASTSGNVPDENVKGAQFVEGNPYLTLPLQAGEKDVSQITVPDVLSDGPAKDNHASILETFTPAIEAMRDRFSDDADGDGDGKSKLLPDKRPAVQFKFKMSKKVLGQSLDLDLRNRSIGKPVAVTVREEERDEKKRRAEYILRQSMENPQELTQL
ncbi:transcription initiation factor TFIID subunit 8 [Punica granatum]|uniref:Transcription initiation factor TFIID subunit 8 n=2 Tax=Punica granatum TaxID=22663 RepID=A0A218XB24_PUNGR|nr:transcription initiation factor TFIID subunit 8 [Punica granatum]OWM82425.1 hypothetical protein CDL15_Pgr001999 [Punica granatum]PKI65126.1 hypothetical protein CRG98_014440 [Punica granatum]